MDYEKKYNEALERAKAVIEVSANQEEAKGIATSIFPELQENEDERIRKRIYGLIYHNDALLDKDELLAYLEKQKVFSEHGAGLYYRHGDGTFKYVGRPAWEYPSLDDEEDEQKEQKPTMIQWTGNNLKEVIDFTGKSPKFEEWFKSWDEYEDYVHSHGNILKLFCEDGSHYEVPVGAWIVKTPDGYNVASQSKFVQKPAAHQCDCTSIGCHINNSKRWCHKYNKEVPYEDCNSSCSGYEQKSAEIPLMNGDADLYFDNWNQQHANATKRQCFEEGMRYNQRLQKPAEWSDKFEENIRILLTDKLTWHSKDGKMSSTVFIDDKTLKDIVSGIWFYVGKEAAKYPNKELKVEQNPAEWSTPQWKKASEELTAEDWKDNFFVKQSNTNLYRSNDVHKGELYLKASEVEELLENLPNLSNYISKPAEWRYPYGKNETVDQLIGIAECLEQNGDCSFNGYKGSDCGKFLREIARREVEMGERNKED